MREQLELMIAGDPRIRLLDRVPREQLRRLFADADVCVSPSLWECWPNTVLEAFEQQPAGAGDAGRRAPRHGRAGRDGGWLAADTGADALADRMEGSSTGRDEVAELTPRAPAAQLRAAHRRRAGARGLPRARRRGAQPPAAPGRRGRRRAAGLGRRPLLPDGALRRGDAGLDRRPDLSPDRDDRRQRRLAARPRTRSSSELAERYRISVVTQPNSGLGQARNLGIELSRGRYVLPLDPDDVILPSFVERCVEVLERRPELAYVTAWSEYIDERGRPLDAGGYRPLGNTVASLERENLAGSAMALFRRRLFERGLRYSPDLTSYEDWLHLSRAARRRPPRPRDPRDPAALPRPRGLDAAGRRAAPGASG